MGDHRPQTQFDADVAKAEATILSCFRNFPTVQRESSHVRDVYKSGLPASKQQTFDRLLWPHIVRRIESNPNMFVRRVAAQGDQVRDQVFWRWIEDWEMFLFR
jgi:hypothetical protein